MAGVVAARKSSPNNAPVPSRREKVRPATPSSWPYREKTRPASSKSPKTDHFCRAGRTFSRFPIRFTPQGELFRASPTRNEQSTRTTGPARTHKTTCIVPPCPNREKVRPTTPPWPPRAKKFAQQHPHLGQTAKKLSQRAQKHRKPTIFAEQGELFRASQSESPHRANFFAQPQHATSNPRAPPARRAQESTHKKAHATKHPRQGTYTSATGRELLVVHRSLLPLVVIHRLTRKA